MPTYKPYIEIATLPANSNGEITILEEHLDENHAVLMDVLESSLLASFETGGITQPGTVAIETSTNLRVQARAGVSQDARVTLFVLDQVVSLSAVPDGDKIRAYINPEPGSFTAVAFTDADTGEALTHNLIVRFGKVAYTNEPSGYPAIPTGAVPIAKLSKTAGVVTLDLIEDTPPLPKRWFNPRYDAPLGFVGQPLASALDWALIRQGLGLYIGDAGITHARTPAAGSRATGSVTFGPANVAAGDTVTIGSTTYTFQSALGAAYDVLIGADLTASRDNLVAAINGAAGEGSTYGTGTVAHPDVTASSTGADIANLEAKAGGSAGNSVALSEASTNLVVSGATLTGGGQDVVFDIRKNNIDIGTVAFAEGVNAGTITINLDTLFAPGDTLELVAPVVQDDTLADVQVAFSGKLT